MKTYLVVCSVLLVLLAQMTRGAEEHYQLGHRKDWREVDILGQFADDIDWFAKFNERIYLVTKDDRVYAFGRQDRSQNVFGVSNTTGLNVPKPTEIVELRGKKIVKFASGFRHMLALSADGTVWAWGESKYGELGVGGGGGGNEVEHVQPMRVKTNDKAIDIGAADGTSFALTGSGHVLAWGWNANGECGNGNTNHQFSPVKVILDQVVVSLHTTYYGTSVALTNNSQLYVWGFQVKSSPILSPVTSKRVSVAATWHMYFILTDDGQHIWRSIKKDQRRVDLLYNGTTKFTALYADQFSFKGFLVARSIDGRLWVWHNAEVSNMAPALATTADIVEAFALYHHNAYQPFMIKLNGTAGNTTTTTAW